MRSVMLCSLLLEVLMKVKEVLAYLDSVFPLASADDFDNPGLVVGDPEAEVIKVATALDVSPQTIKDAVAAGANLLVAHHPIYLEAPNPVTPAIASSSFAGECLWLAANNNLSIISMHTNLDMSDRAQQYLADLLGFTYVGHLEEPAGYGAVMGCEPMSLEELAKHCAKVFDTQAIAWGLGSDKPIQNLVYCSGSTGDLGKLAINKGLDCVICGENGYHRLLELDEAGVKVVVLGHDASEKPFAKLLADILSDVVTDSCITVLDEPRRWQAFA